MKVSTRNIKDINFRLKYLYDNFNIDPLSEDVKIGEESIYINYPDEWSDDTWYLVEDFLRYTDNLDNIQIIDNHTVISGKIRQTIISVNEYYYDYLVPNVKFETEEYSMRIVDNPFLIGIVASLIPQG